MPPASTAPLVIALLGAECTGKSTLASQLATGLAADPANRVRQVDECLRTWCEATGRTPTVHEQALLARLQQDAIESAIRSLTEEPAASDGVHAPPSADPPCPSTAWVLADTTPLQTAAYSGHYFSDARLDADATAWHRRHVHLTLLMGLDLPWRADGHLRDGPRAQQGTDDRLRQLLQTAGLPHVTLYGQGQRREAAAWQALAAHIGHDHPAHKFIKMRASLADPSSAKQLQSLSMTPLCLHCDDAPCEHRLFSRLNG